LGGWSREGRKAFFWGLLLAGGGLLVLVGLRLLKGAVAARPEYQVLPRVTRLERVPAWMGPIGRAQLVRLVEGAFPGPFQVFQSLPLEVALRRIRAQGVARKCRAERLLPSQVRLVLEIPRPVAFFRDPSGRAHLLDAWGRLLPFPLSGVKGALPCLEGLPRDPQARKEAFRAGAAVAWEVERSFLPALGGKFPFLAVDLSNLGYRLLADGERAEIRIVLAGADGHRVILEWDRSPFSPFGNIPLSKKIDVARKILARYPGFEGVLAADLRWELRWDQWLTLASGREEGR